MRDRLGRQTLFIYILHLGGGEGGHACVVTGHFLSNMMLSILHI